MKRLIDKYVTKIIGQGLSNAGGITLIGLDADMTSNVPLHEIRSELISVFDHMNISSLLYAEPAEPYKSIVAYLTARENNSLLPNDCETRTFLHDIPIIHEFSAAAMSNALSKRKAAIVGGTGIISYGTVSPEQAFVSFSSVCFSTYVKFFTDVMFHLDNCTAGKTKQNKNLLDTWMAVADMIVPDFPPCTDIPAAPPRTEDETYRQLTVTGRELVKRKLVDSYFGNISYFFGDTVYISQTGSSLDELETCIDAVPLDGSSSSGLTASSELSAHINIYRKTGRMAIVHGHPKFTVIMSMSCRKDSCDLSTCYRSCTEQRYVSGIPLVSGEIGTGPTGLVNTVPQSMAANAAAIVYGHGIFSSAPDSFRPAFELMQSAEETCMREYFAKIRRLI